MVAVPERRRRFTLQITILALFLAIVVPLFAVMVTMQQRVSRDVALAAGTELIAEVNRTVAAATERLFGRAITVASIAPEAPEAPLTAAVQATTPILLAALDRLPDAASVYFGYPDGGFYRVAVLRPHNRPLADAIGAPATAAFGVQVIPPASEPIETWLFLNLDGEQIGRSPPAPTTFDPRTRVWYQQAAAREGVIITPPYVFAASGETGITVARRMGGKTPAVFGVDMTLVGVSRFLADLRGRARYPIDVAMFDHDGKILAASFAWDAAENSEPTAVGRLQNAGARAAAMRYLETRVNFTGERLSTPGGVVLAAVQELPVTIGEHPAHVAVVASLETFLAPITRAGAYSLLASAALLLITLPMIGLVAGSLSAPLKQLANEADRIRHFEIGEPLRLQSRVVEVQGLIEATDSMKSTLSAFAKYVPRELVRSILASGIAPEPGGTRRDVTLLFTDIQDFTPMADSMSAEELMRKVSEYFERMVSTVLARAGTVDKFVGDCIMAYWNAPQLQADHQALGCIAALACRDLSNRMCAEWTARGEAPFYTRFGLHAGECVVGNVGSQERLDFTVMGSPVNLASRLEGLNKHYGTQILMSEAVNRATHGRFLCRTVDLVLPKGAQTPMAIYELVGTMPGARGTLADYVASATQVQQCQQWEETYAAYRTHDWQRAVAALDAYLARFPDDRLAQVYMERAVYYLQEPPEPGWAGVEKFNVK